MSDPSSSRNLNISGNVDRSVIIVGDGNSSAPFQDAVPLSARSESSPEKLVSLERLELIQALNALPADQFEAIVLALNPPRENMPEASAPQSSQTQALLAWLESPIGLGSSELKVVLERILSTQQQSAEQSQNNELLQSLTRTLATNVAPKYDLRGASFGGGFAETVHGNQQVSNHPHHVLHDEDVV